MKGKRLVILGAGESGVGAALLGKMKNYEVFVSDNRLIDKKYKNILIKNEIEYEEQQHDFERIVYADIIVKSPGIPEKVPVVQKALEKNIPVISEIEFASFFTDSKIIGITGSNGKTTTTLLIGHLLKHAGIDVGIGGNVGKSFAGLISEHHYEVYVLELSSFQLDGIIDFKPDVGILLNVTPDHLDRYNYKFDDYVASKFRLMKNMGPKDLFLYNANDEASLKFLKKEPGSAKVLAINGKEGNDLVKVHEEIYDLSKTKLIGLHNKFNALCAIHAVKEIGISQTKIQEGLESFSNAPHRLQFVKKVNGIEFINDSKATNVDAVYYALQAIKKPIIWIVGGQDKGNDYDHVYNLVKKKVKAIICLGLDNNKIMKYFIRLNIPIKETSNMGDTISLAIYYGEEGDVVLLSPACASFNLFDNYEDRGDQFISEVNHLKQVVN